VELRRVARSARFRLTFFYTAAVFALAAVVLGGLYVGLAHRLKPAPKFVPAVYRTIPDAQTNLPFRRVIVLSATGDPAAEMKNHERRQALSELRKLTLLALAALFLPALGIGWILAGRVLRPLGEITDAARRIQARSLSDRVALQGPEDELKLLADSFDDMLGRLDASFTAQRQFVADASHELRNPLAVIRTNADVALREERLPEPVRRRLEAVHRASERMRLLVDDLLALARLELTPADLVEVDVTAVVAEVAEEHDAVARTLGVSLEHAAEPGLRAVGDTEAMRRALGNLLDNALRHAPAESAVRLAAARHDASVVITVADDGVGLSEDEREHVFDRFWRSDSSRSRESGGSGLGLAIVRRIAEAHGGDVAVRSAPGNGSTFELRLPALSPLYRPGGSLEVGPQVGAGAAPAPTSISPVSTSASPLHRLRTRGS